MSLVRVAHERMFDTLRWLQRHGVGRKRWGMPRSGGAQGLVADDAED
jgi:hypothetical protein